uniref:Uncharacterized protein n=1 Tax=Aegilops tauschii subsp. strangulata TaxID=200361 RepID=A0A453JJX3_AEGTS
VSHPPPSSSSPSSFFVMTYILATSVVSTPRFRNKGSIERARTTSCIYPWRTGATSETLGWRRQSPWFQPASSSSPSTSSAASRMIPS